eukprot:scaffold53423_cov81-Phaeocystis_antarctica.AAC.2
MVRSSATAPPTSRDESIGCAKRVEECGRGEAHGVLLALGVQRRRHSELEADSECRGDEEETGDGRGPRHVPMSKASPIWPRPTLRKLRRVLARHAVSGGQRAEALAQRVARLCVGDRHRAAGAVLAHGGDVDGEVRGGARGERRREVSL